MSRESLPIVAILGRPNVGKSTLFNRYAGRPRALVEGTPGVTRDRIAEVVEVGGRSVLVVDTAGLDPEPQEGELGRAVQAQARAAMESADALLLVVDGQAGLLPQEEALARELRRSPRPLLVAVNKIDHPSHAERRYEFHALGLEPLRAISAEHGTGAWGALEELVAALPAPEAVAEGEPPEAGEGEALRVAVVGRPNVGKSSLFNRVLGVERSVVSEVPGTTRDAVDLRLERAGVPWVFVDTAGLRRPGRRDRLAEPGSAVMTARALERADLAVVVADAAEGFTDRDARILGLVRERGCAALLVLNKWDLVEGEHDRVRRVEAEVDRRLAGEADVRVLRVSAKTGAGAERIFPELERLGSAATRELSTAELNQWLKEAVARHEPAMAQRGARRRPLRFFYATQTGVRPPTFVLFCTDPRGVQAGYRRYLENRLKERFGLGGVPVRVRLRARRPPAKP